MDAGGIPHVEDGGTDAGPPDPSCASSYGPYTAGDWLQFGFDPGFTGDNPDEQTISAANVASLVRQWGIGCDDEYFAVVSQAPAVMGGRLFVSKAGDRLKAYDAKCGRLLWEFGKGNAGWAHQPVVSRDGIVFYLEGSDPTELYAVDAQTGAQRWQAPVSFDLIFDDSRVPVVDEARALVYVIDAPFSGDTTLFALDKTTGEISWFANRSKTGHNFLGLYPLLVNGKLYVSAGTDMPSADQMVRLDGDSHAIDLTFEAPSQEAWEVFSYGACSGMLVTRFISDASTTGTATHIVAYALDAPAVVWRKDLAEPREAGVDLSLAAACDPSSGLIYVPNGPDLIALDAKTGATVWTYASTASVFAPSLANGLVYFVSGSNVYSLDQRTGNKVAQFRLGYSGYSNTQVAISHGMLFFSGNGGDCDLFAMGLASK